MLGQVDHVVVLVACLDAAVESYRARGFQVVIGGEHPGGTHNALVGFADGAYLELLAFREPERPHAHRWYRFLSSGPGVIDVCLASDDLPGEVERLRSRGLPYHGPAAGSRRRPDGQVVEWRGATPTDDLTGALPFLIQDVTPRELRVPGGEQAQHALGVIGLAAVTVAVSDLERAIREYQSLLDAGEPERGQDEQFQAITATFTLGPHRIVLAQPAGSEGLVAHRIRLRGDGPVEVALLVERLAEPRRLEIDGAHFVLQPA
ncbi:VOC family protein [Thermomicrobiaceae bacterium CFH 74404]|uniref:VOC family protein n=1 Tax=Thermalbibacter longus TaxID=2951981 RepID=A0AA41WFV7_9BACT|nr:VOC family protein [Thermalbibacter longus]MCM8749635.1 VOC family protein [Thermalbibacter longus]